MSETITQNDESNVTYLNEKLVTGPGCTGNACGSVGYRWDNGNIFSNLSSDKNITVTIKNWNASESGTLSPGESRRFFLQVFENPFVANYS